MSMSKVEGTCKLFRAVRLGTPHDGFLGFFPLSGSFTFFPKVVSGA